MINDIDNKCILKVAVIGSSITKQLFGEKTPKQRE